MKTKISFMLLLVGSSAFCQNIKDENTFIPFTNDHRIIKSERYERENMPIYTSEYEYNEKGMLTSVKTKYSYKGVWRHLETKEYVYNSNKEEVVCIYKPDVNALKNTYVSRNIQDNVDATDTLKFEKGKLVYLAQCRIAYGQKFITQFNYTYDEDELVNEKKSNYILHTSKEKKLTKKPYNKIITEKKFNYNEGVLQSIIELDYNVNRKWHLRWNNNTLEKIDIYNTRNNEEELELEYNCKSENGMLVEVETYYFTGNEKRSGQTHSYKYDNNNNLISATTSGDSEGIRITYEYEKGNGNASLFEKRNSIYDYIKPFIK